MNKPLVVITGASSGFGAEIAKRFNKEGFPLLLLGRRLEKMEQLPLDFEHVLLKQVDVTDLTAFKSAVREAEERYGKTDLLINNAGVMLLGNIETQQPEEWQTMLDTNVRGVLNGMQIVLEDMKNRQHGTILNMSSIAGFKAFVNHAAYVASKFGVHGATETIRQEVAEHNVRVSLVSPGYAETELLHHVTNEALVSGIEDWKSTIGGITLDPRHVADTVFFIYSMPQDVTVREVALAITKQTP
ncbi:MULTISPECIES: SDR family oxidoreductase [Exiguobacterium]|nr:MULTISPECIES: SDR family oxidoreductase [Exiguobacterium]MBF8154446.1 SDR family oxidoreductase [Exiguobacterium sp. TBG-PICH-001]QZY86789.1 SDR family oxidoreductase [Exiguobacterium acetylicum]